MIHRCSNVKIGSTGRYRWYNATKIVATKIVASSPSPVLFVPPTRRCGSGTSSTSRSVNYEKKSYHQFAVIHHLLQQRYSVKRRPARLQLPPTIPYQQAQRLHFRNGRDDHPFFQRRRFPPNPIGILMATITATRYQVPVLVQQQVSYSNTTTAWKRDDPNTNNNKNTNNNNSNSSSINTTTPVPPTSYFQRMVRAIQRFFQPQVVSTSTAPPVSMNSTTPNHIADAETNQRSGSVIDITIDPPATTSTLTNLENNSQIQQQYRIPPIRSTTGSIQQIRSQMAPILLKGTTTLMTKESDISVQSNDPDIIATTVIQTLNGSITRTITGVKNHHHWPTANTATAVPSVSSSSPTTTTIPTLTNTSSPEEDPTTATTTIITIATHPTTTTTISLRRTRPKIQSPPLSSMENGQIVNTISDIVASGGLRTPSTKMVKPVPLPTSLQALRPPPSFGSSVPVVPPKRSAITPLETTISEPTDSSSLSESDPNATIVQHRRHDRNLTPFETTRQGQPQPQQSTIPSAMVQRQPPEQPRTAMPSATIQQQEIHPQPSSREADPTTPVSTSSTTTTTTITALPTATTNVVTVATKRKRKKKKGRRSNQEQMSQHQNPGNIPSSATSSAAEQGASQSGLQTIQQQQPRLMVENYNGSSTNPSLVVLPLSLQQESPHYATSNTNPSAASMIGDVTGSMAATSSDAGSYGLVHGNNDKDAALRSQLIGKILGEDRTRPIHRHQKSHLQKSNTPSQTTSPSHTSSSNGERFTKSTRTNTRKYLQSTIQDLPSGDITNRIRSQIPCLAQHDPDLTKNPIAAKSMDTTPPPNAQSALSHRNEIQSPEPLALGHAAFTNSATTAVPPITTIPPTPVVYQIAQLQSRLSRSSGDSAKISTAGIATLDKQVQTTNDTKSDLRSGSRLPHSLRFSETNQPSSVPNVVVPTQQVTSYNVAETSHFVRTSRESNVFNHSHTGTDAVKIDDTSPAAPSVDPENLISQLRSRLQVELDHQKLNALSMQGVEEKIVSSNNVSMVDRLQSRRLSALTPSVQQQTLRRGETHSGETISNSATISTQEPVLPLQPQFSTQEVQNIGAGNKSVIAAISSKVSARSAVTQNDTGQQLMFVSKGAITDQSEMKVLSPLTNEPDLFPSDRIASKETRNDAILQPRRTFELTRNIENVKAEKRSKDIVAKNSGLSILEKMQQKLENMQKKQNPSNQIKKYASNTLGHVDAANRMAAQELKKVKQTSADVGPDGSLQNSNKKLNGIDMTLQQQTDLSTHTSEATTNTLGSSGLRENNPATESSIRRTNENTLLPPFQHSFHSTGKGTNFTTSKNELEPTWVLPNTHQQSISHLDTILDDTNVSNGMEDASSNSTIATRRTNDVLKKMRLKVGVDKPEPPEVAISVASETLATEAAILAGNNVLMQQSPTYTETGGTKKSDQTYDIQRMFSVGDTSNSTAAMRSTSVVLQKMRLKVGIDKPNLVIPVAHQKSETLATEPAILADDKVIVLQSPTYTKTGETKNTDQPYENQRMTMFCVDEPSNSTTATRSTSVVLQTMRLKVGVDEPDVPIVHQKSETLLMSQYVRDVASEKLSQQHLPYTDAMDAMPIRVVQKQDESISYASSIERLPYHDDATIRKPVQPDKLLQSIDKKRNMKVAPKNIQNKSQHAASTIPLKKHVRSSYRASPGVNTKDILDKIEVGLSELLPKRKPEVRVQPQTELKVSKSLAALRATFMPTKSPHYGGQSFVQMSQPQGTLPKLSDNLQALGTYRTGDADKNRSHVQSQEGRFSQYTRQLDRSTTSSLPISEIIRNMQMVNGQFPRTNADANGNGSSLSKAALTSFERIHPPIVGKWRETTPMTSEWRMDTKRPHIDYQRGRREWPRPLPEARKKPVFVDPKQQAISLPSFAISVAETSQLFRVKTSRLIEILSGLGETRPTGISEGDDEAWMVSTEILELIAIEIGQAINESVASPQVMTDEELMLMRRAAADSTRVAAIEAGVTEEPAYSSYPVRPPVVCIMGHVDHGKTTLMDALRRRAANNSGTQKSKGKEKKKDKKKDKGKKGDKNSADVAGTEAGGITQVISAFQVPLIENDNDTEFVTFLDTPGHAAFTAMRQSGSDAADIIVLVVAADDGVSEQTIEILDFYKSIVKGAGSGGISMVVAMNKIDKPGVDVEESTRKIQSQLLEQGILTEGMPSDEGVTEYGPAVQLIPVSGKTGKGLDDLIDGLALQSEMMDLRAPTDARAEGIVMDARVDKGMGIVADCIVRWGSIKKGDLVVTGTHKGKVRLLKDVNDGQLQQGVPSQPVRLIGFDTLPKAGDPFVCVESEEIADDLVSRRKAALGVTDAAPVGVGEAELQSAGRHMMVHTWKEALETKHNLKVDDPNAPSRIPVVVKADADGTLAAIRDSLLQLSAKSDCNIFIDLVKAGVGPLFGTEIQMAQECNATIICFNLKNDQALMSVAEENGVKIIQSDIIYSLLDEARLEFSKYLPEQPIEVVHGRAKVLATYLIGGIADKVAGLKVIDGTIYRDKSTSTPTKGSTGAANKATCLYRIFRGGAVIAEGLPASSLKHFKDDVDEMSRGKECGISLSGYNEYEMNDEIECYAIEMQRPKI